MNDIQLRSKLVGAMIRSDLDRCLKHKKSLGVESIQPDCENSPCFDNCPVIKSMQLRREFKRLTKEGKSIEEIVAALERM